MKKFNLISMLAVILFVSVSCKDDDDDNVVNQIPEADKTFVMNAADGGMFEVKAGEMAVAKGDTMSMAGMAGMDSMSVKSFGQMMITDHTKANNELMTIATSKNVTVPTSLTTAKQQKLDSLSALSGSSFNTTYVKMMVASHQETVNLFQKEKDSGADMDLKAFATKTLPTVEHHLEMAKMMQSTIK